MPTALGALALAVSACFPDPDYGGTHYLCSDGQSCPDGFMCMDGVCTDRPVYLDDLCDGQFAAGALAATECSGDQLQLAGGETSGTFVSRVFDAGRTVTWDRIAWIPSAPHGRPLPDDAASESGFAGGAVDMFGNLLLLHADGSASLLDYSGRGNDASIISGGLEDVEGVFDQAISTTASSYFAVNLLQTDDFDLGVGDFTFALWVNTSESCAEERLHMGIRQVGVGEISLGCGEAVSDCPSSADGRAVVRLDPGSAEPDGGELVCGITRINDGRWHHVAVTKAGHASSVVTLYVDGVVDGGAGAFFLAPFDFAGAAELGVGGLIGITPSAQVASDEIAVWSRALDADEVAALYLRGVQRIWFEVRACAAPACDDDPAFAPVDPCFFSDDCLEPPLFQDDLLLSGRYAQYRARFQTQPGVASPVLDQVELTFEP